MVLAGSIAERNCIANIRPPEGLGYAAVTKLFYLTVEALRRSISRVSFKDGMQ
jgi:ethanolamine ammonia-lyase small subunit